MGNVIKSGDSGKTAFVDNSNRLLTFATSETQQVSAARHGDAFSLTHANINLTSDSLSYMFYAKNNDRFDWVLGDIKTQFGLSTGGNGGDFTSQVVVNPTGGTLIDSGSTTGGINLHVGDPQPLAGVFLYGFEGATITGGSSLFPGLIVEDQAVQIFSEGPIILPPGSSFAYGITPPTGNTGMNVKISMIVFRDTGE